MNRGGVTPRPEIAPSLFGFPQINILGLTANTASQFTPWALLLLIGVPQSPRVAS